MDYEHKLTSIVFDEDEIVFDEERERERSELRLYRQYNRTKRKIQKQ